jgi:hypothetical protein
VIAPEIITLLKNRNNSVKLGGFSSIASLEKSPTFDWFASRDSGPRMLGWLTNLVCVEPVPNLQESIHELRAELTQGLRF